MPTALTRWDPFSEMSDLRARFDRMFDELVNGRGDRDWSPAVDVMQDNGNLVMRADVPGIKPDEVKIEVEGDVLTMFGEHLETIEKQDDDFVRRERRHGSFRRSLQLPSGVDPDSIEATTHDGILEVKIPIPKESKPRRVEITPTAG